MKISETGLQLIERFEGLKLQAYQDQNGIWTIGYGHANAHKGQYETQAAAEADLCGDSQEAEDAVNCLVTVALTQNQFDALCSFTYNEGRGRLKSSTLLVLLDNGDYAGAAQQLLTWDIIGGKASAGLERRRMAEQALFLKAA